MWLPTGCRGFRPSVTFSVSASLRLTLKTASLHTFQFYSNQFWMKNIFVLKLFAQDADIYNYRNNHIKKEVQM